MTSDEQRQHDAGERTRATSWLADLGCCLRFFSRVPVPPLASDDDPAAPPNLSHAVRCLPLAGFALGLPAATVLLILGQTALPSLLLAAFALTALAATTGALHEDGFADVADGFFGGATRERRLEIMADSRIGTFGGLALILLQISLAAGLAAIIVRQGLDAAAMVIVCGAAVSRAAALWPWTLLDAARPGGLSHRFGAPSLSTARLATGIAVLINVGLTFNGGFSHWLITLAGAGIGAFGVGALAKARIGGHTGDVIGAAQQAAWLGYVAAYLMLP
ncbi:cobalamin-5'-phosphate synthase [Breoghania corrubedonensis]|uniref:Adenosylcobinamide-GDP ribazoletransferase n=1 Tax=Breoghania corrubedonensis TaxID=665038 RepID=A0A2T5V1C9_9HYPH|nr:adenosylcobinamide-GDP ribazoletransferase [Breoghania corrubedonensis]PTW57565.1 cobalamin-5'-phosphate synthase [Breoghania corrubedonensis]